MMNKEKNKLHENRYFGNIRNKCILKKYILIIFVKISAKYKIITKN